MKYDASRVRAAAMEAIDNWDFSIIDDGEKQRAVLERIVEKPFVVEYDKGFTDIFDWLAEYASATAADMK